ncbi:hypothetical protein CR513_38644, partial [Mucuna pruriens]
MFSASIEGLNFQRPSQWFVEELNVLRRFYRPKKISSKKWNDYIVPIRKNLLKAGNDLENYGYLRTCSEYTSSIQRPKL